VLELAITGHVRPVGRRVDGVVTFAAAGSFNLSWGQVACLVAFAVAGALRLSRSQVARPADEPRQQN